MNAPFQIPIVAPPPRRNPALVIDLATYATTCEMRGEEYRRANNDEAAAECFCAAEMAHDLMLAALRVDDLGRGVAFAPVLRKLVPMVPGCGR